MRVRGPGAGACADTQVSNSPAARVPAQGRCGGCCVKSTGAGPQAPGLPSPRMSRCAGRGSSGPGIAASLQKVRGVPCRRAGALPACAVAGGVLRCCARGGGHAGAPQHRGGIRGQGGLNTPKGAVHEMMAGEGMAREESGKGRRRGWIRCGRARAPKPAAACGLEADPLGTVPIRYYF